jgi:aryl-alcohol dehydrogenase-like predicted oxidoreductase
MPEVFGVLDDLVRAGNICHYGVSVEEVSGPRPRRTAMTCRPRPAASERAASAAELL